MAELILQDQEGRCATCEFDGHILGCGSFGFIRKLSSSHGPIDPSHDAFNGKTVLKTLSHQFNEEHFVHLQRLTTLSHPNLVRCLMVGYPVNPSLLVPKLIHIILEYCEGGNLHQLAIKEPHKMTEKYILHLAEQIAKGIRYLHTRDPIIVYGDLKGENILFQDTAFMQVKIADLDSFGMFKGSQTLHGFMKNPSGSPTHMSPEMLMICDKLNSLSNMDERVGRRTDMYSFACLILELINKGEVPYTDKNKLSIAQNELSSLLAIRNVINKGGSPDVSILFSAPNTMRYSRELQALLNQCLHCNPAERPDCHDLLACVSYLRTDPKRSYSDAETQTESFKPEYSHCDAETQTITVSTEQQAIAAKNSKEKESAAAENLRMQRDTVRKALLGT
ncbi:putative serine/threonine-protein kinase drkD [Hypsibius exemplaris]|uniref:Serine/threonine-protein kinase drkD n=1 Tax=Hypsibius exemplaris TaxID=2072580 RepID=A0A9X6NHM8_HYPEX|nr:putative serine/threonine-protein kinase drkD [Hypsibius exemplaris]